jgi:hypothetical protein
MFGSCQIWYMLALNYECTGMIHALNEANFVHI